MKTLENENEKVHRICEHLRKEALEPAEKQAAALIEDAKAQSDEIVKRAEAHAVAILENAKLEIQKEKNVLESSLAKSTKQALEMLRQEIEQKLFNPKLKSLIAKQTANPSVIAKMIDSLLHGIKTSGIEGNVKAYIPAEMSKEEVNHLLSSEVIQSIEAQSVVNGDFKGGAKLKLVDQHITFEITDAGLKELMAEFIRADLRKYVFDV